MKHRNTMNQLTLMLCFTWYSTSGAFINSNDRNIISPKVATKRSCNLFMSYLDSLSRKNEDSQDNQRQEYNLNPSQSVATDQDIQRKYNDDQSFFNDPSFRREYESPIQAYFKIGDKVRVISGGYAGNVGHVVDVYPDMVKVELSQTRTVLFEIQQIRNLSSNNVESRRAQFVSSSDKNTNSVPFNGKSVRPSQDREFVYNYQRPNSRGYDNINPSSEYNAVDNRSSNILSNDQVNQFIKEMKEWRAYFFNGNSRKVEKFSRKFHCRNFQSALEAVNTIGLLAENCNYRFDLHVTSYCDVEIVLCTKSTEGEVTLDDMELVKAMDVEISNYVV